MSEQESDAQPVDPQGRMALLKQITLLRQHIEDSKAAGNQGQVNIYRGEFFQLLRQLPEEDIRLLAGVLFEEGKGRI